MADPTKAKLEKRAVSMTVLLQIEAVAAEVETDVILIDRLQLDCSRLDMPRSQDGNGEIFVISSVLARKRSVSELRAGADVKVSTN